MGVKIEWPTIEAVTASIVVVVADRSHHGYVRSSTSSNKGYLYFVSFEPVRNGRNTWSSPTSEFLSVHESMPIVMKYSSKEEYPVS